MTYNALVALALISICVSGLSFWALTMTRSLWGQFMWYLLSIVAATPALLIIILTFGTKT